ncbi:uncharacterized protein LOC100680304 isoform X2 [Nasonia vitripennis]|uniref:Gag-like protein n=1 Tax=Nasonia vitripennis TaxID=7425 RepID=A0A7M7LKH6_NASVI|nr:uncharacterized protein LOC100680304 isoform X2 [Nasonia vitripennis]
MMENQESGYNRQDRKLESIADSAALCPKKSQEQALTCWLYVSRSEQLAGQEHGLPRASLEETIRAVEPTSAWHVSETQCGLIAGFAREADADKLLQRGDLEALFGCAVQVARFSDRDSRYRQAVLLRDVPWAIPIQDVNSALARQGIATGSVERLRHYVRVEVLDSSQYEQLLRDGLNFYGASFVAIPERWWRGNTTSGAAGPQNGQIPEVPSNQPPTEDVLQCYRCQGFWHVAANCRHLPRCVRCGEYHSVDFCPRPRNNPICCHCSGPHHAGYRQCPVRLQLLNSTPVSLTLSTNRFNSASNHLLFPQGKSGNGNNATAANNNNASAPATQRSNPSV